MTDQALFASPFPRPAVIAVLVHEGRALLVRRANPPDAGLWGFPGGKIDYAETVREAALRELREETGIQARALDILTVLDILGPPQHYILIAVQCEWVSGVPIPSDDALEARWFALEDLNPALLPMSADVETVARLAAMRAP